MSIARGVVARSKREEALAFRLTGNARLVLPRPWNIKWKEKTKGGREKEWKTRTKDIEESRGKIRHSIARSWLAHNYVRSGTRPNRSESSPSNWEKFFFLSFFLSSFLIARRSAMDPARSISSKNQSTRLDPKSNFPRRIGQASLFKRFRSPTRVLKTDPGWRLGRGEDCFETRRVHEEEIKGRSEDGKLEARWMRSRTFPAGIYGRPAHVKRVAGILLGIAKYRVDEGKCVSRCVSSCLYIGILNNDSRAERASRCLINIFFVLTHEWKDPLFSPSLSFSSSPLHRSLPLRENLSLVPCLLNVAG